jgi:amino acid/amide ABC transporter ATP-binding protein 2, HAAT family (TC 3.A.1.4.-)
MLKVNNINVYYGDVQALWDVSFEVKEGEIVGLIGANGAGKTTTMNTISGLLRPRKGNIEFLGQDITKIPAYRTAGLGIAHVPEARRLFPEMTTKENLEMGSLVPEAKAMRKESMERVFELFPILKERAWQAAGTLSGGEQQMLAIGRGLMSRPKLIIMDEPSLGLAPFLVDEVFKIIEQINREGITVFLVEQNVMHTLHTCTRACVLETGKIALTGTGKELLNNEHIKEAYLGV